MLYDSYTKVYTPKLYYNMVNTFLLRHPLVTSLLLPVYAMLSFDQYYDVYKPYL